MPQYIPTHLDMQRVSCSSIGVSDAWILATSFRSGFEKKPGARWGGTVARSYLPKSEEKEVRSPKRKLVKIYLL